jgi:phage head maturation protease
MTKGGFLNAMSVVFIGLKWEHNGNGGIAYLEQELLELSLVTVPTNPEPFWFRTQINLRLTVRAGHYEEK